MTKSNPASPDDEGRWEPITEVAVAVIHRTRGPGPTEGALLATLRAPEGLRGDLWELPGGKIDPGETPEVAVCRELREELELEFVPTQGRLFGTAGDHDPSQPRERTVRLPMMGSKGSLNVGVAFGVAAYFLRFGAPPASASASAR